MLVPGRARTRRRPAHRAARGGELHGVADEVLHDPLQVPGAATDERQPLLEVDVGLGHGPVGVADPREGQQVVDEALQPLGVALDDPE
jgi:hypothetical protein